MAVMTHRATFAFDLKTMRRLKSLASRWHVSQAEVIRRALLHAEEKAINIEPNAIDMLASLHESGHGLLPEIGNAYVEEVYEARKEWRNKE